MSVARTGHTTSDEAIDREIEQALAVDPSPEFLTRVRARIASAPAASGWRLSWRFVGASAFATATVLTLTFVRLQHLPVLPAVPARPAPFAMLAPPAAPAVPAVPVPAPPAGPALSGRDAAALRVLVRSIREGRVDPAVLDGVQADLTPMEPFDSIAIQPIASEPIPPLALLEGAFQ